MINPYVIFEITPRCNSSCLYCYNVWQENINYPKGELALTDVERLFNRVLKDVKPKWIILAGGEPLLRDDIVAITSFFKERNMRIGIATNGTLCTDKLLQELINNGVGYFEVSLDSADEKIYNSLTSSHQFKNVRQAILSIKKHKKPLTVSIAVTKLNYTDVGNIIDLCFAFSVDSIALNRFVPGGRGIKNIEKLKITNRELESVLKAAEEKTVKYKIPINITIPVESCEIEHKQFPHLNFGTCGCGRNKWVIDPLGNLRTCEQNPEILGSLFEDSFEELTRSEKVSNFRSNNAKLVCSTCEMYSKCGGGCRFLKQ